MNVGNATHHEPRCITKVAAKQLGSAGKQSSQHMKTHFIFCCIED